MSDMTLTTSVNFHNCFMCGGMIAINEEHWLSNTGIYAGLRQCKEHFEVKK